MSTVRSSESEAPAPFLTKTYEMVDDPTTDGVVSWGPRNDSFVVRDSAVFARDLLPKYFKHSNFSSFMRQAHTYGFKRVYSDNLEYAHEGFLRGQKHLLTGINRKKSSDAHSQPQMHLVQNVSGSICHEVGHFMLQQEVVRLKRDKEVLTQELAKLKQQQQASNYQLFDIGQRLQVMEQQQQKIMSFLVKAMEHPGFLSQFVQENDNNLLNIGGKKKRRFPCQNSSPDGQNVSDQPMINDVTETTLARIRQLGASLLEPETFDNSTLSWSSGVNPAESPPVSWVPPSMPTSSVFSVAVSSSSTPSIEIQSSVGATNGFGAAELPDINVLSAGPQSIPCEFPKVQDLDLHENVADILSQNFIGPEPEIGCINKTGMDAMGPIEVAELTSDPEMFKDNGSPSSFWQQVLTASLLSRETHVDSSALEASEIHQTALQNGSDNLQNMDTLTEKKGLLASNSRE